mgnify:CR=1 FL=1|jgi:hypothetical protein
MKGNFSCTLIQLKRRAANVARETLLTMCADKLQTHNQRRYPGTRLFRNTQLRHFTAPSVRIQTTEIIFNLIQKNQDPTLSEFETTLLL